MTKHELQQIYALTRLPGWKLLKDELHGRLLTRFKQQRDKIGEQLAQASGRALEAVDLYEGFVSYEKLNTKVDDKDEEE